MCIDEDELHLHGTFSSDHGRQLYALLNRCIGHDYCADDKDINKFLKSQYLGVLTNYIYFDSTHYLLRGASFNTATNTKKKPEVPKLSASDSTQFGQDAIVHESEFFWTPVSTQIQFVVPMQLTRTEAILQDLYVNLDDMTELSNSNLFHATPLPSRPFEWFEETQTAISYEMSLNAVRIDRSIMTLLDIGAAVGGLESTIMIFLGIFVSIFTNGNVDQHLIENLYEVAPKNGQHFSQEHRKSKPLFNCRDALRKMRKRKAKQAIAQAYLNREIDILSVLRSLRYLHSGLNWSISTKQQQELQLKSQVYTLQLSASDIAQSSRIHPEPSKQNSRDNSLAETTLTELQSTNVANDLGKCELDPMAFKWR